MIAIGIVYYLLTYNVREPSCLKNNHYNNKGIINTTDSTFFFNLPWLVMCMLSPCKTYPVLEAAGSELFRETLSAEELACIEISRIFKWKGNLL